MVIIQYKNASVNNNSIITVNDAFISFKNNKEYII